MCCTNSTWLTLFQNSHWQAAIIHFHSWSGLHKTLYQENRMNDKKIEKILSVTVGNGRKWQVGGSRGEKSLQRTKKGETGDPNLSEGKERGMWQSQTMEHSEKRMAGLYWTWRWRPLRTLWRWWKVPLQQHTMALQRCCLQYACTFYYRQRTNYGPGKQEGKLFWRNILVLVAPTTSVKLFGSKTSYRHS